MNSKLYGIFFAYYLLYLLGGLGKFFPLIGRAIFGIIIGIIIAILLKNRVKFDSGINFVSKKFYNMLLYF